MEHDENLTQQGFFPVPKSTERSSTHSDIVQHPTQATELLPTPWCQRTEKTLWDPTCMSIPRFVRVVLAVG